MTDPATARHAIHHAACRGRNTKSIAAYLATSRQTLHTTLRRWIEEGRLGLEDKSPGPKPGFRAVDLKTMTTIEKKQKRIRAWAALGCMPPYSAWVSG